MYNIDDIQRNTTTSDIIKAKYDLSCLIWECQKLNRNCDTYGISAHLQAERTNHLSIYNNLLWCTPSEAVTELLKLTEGIINESY